MKKALITGITGQFLKLDCSKIRKVFNWKPLWNLPAAIEKIVTWSLSYYCNDVVGKAMDK